jgi:drug/metabolite transporter (DMT)-like permease
METAMTIAIPAARARWPGFAAGILGVTGFAAMLVVGRLGAAGDALTIYDLTGLRHVGSALVALPIMFWFLPRRLSLRQHLILAVFGGPPFILVLFFGMTLAPASHAAIVLNGTLPLMTALVGWLWSRQLPVRWQALGILVAGIGVFIVGWDALAFGVPGQWRGHLFFLGAAFSVAIWYAVIRHWGLSATETILGTVISSAVIYVPIWLLFLPSGLATAPMQDILVQAGILGVLGVMIGGYSQAYAAKTIGPIAIAAIMSAGPALATILAIPVLGEVPSYLVVAGIAIVALGVLITISSGLRSDVRQPYRAEESSDSANSDPLSVGVR